MNELINKRILVTGASSGIGRAVAIMAASLGASIILIARDEKRLKETLNTLQGTGHQIYSIDATDYSKIEETINEEVGIRGPISGFVHCAGVEKTISFKASTATIFKQIFEINVFAGFEIARILSQKKIVSDQGASFVFLSSVMGKIGKTGAVAYCASKSALLSGVKAMALELASKRIRCNCVLPGVVETELVQNLFKTLPEESIQKILDGHPLGLGRPEDVASLICFLLSDQARWITGSEYTIDGGYSSQ